MQITFGGVIDARSQFIALCVGGIVGRCGAHSAVSSLSQPLLSLIGRDWIVFPARRSAIMLIDFGWTISLFVEFSVSPTMGLVDRPAVVDYGERITQFRGWVGPKSAGTRFPLMTSADNLQVIDRNWKPGSSLELVLNNTRSMRSTNVVVSVLSYGNLVAAKWRWVLNVKECRGGEHALELWDFGQIERGVVSNAEVSWQLKVMKMVFLGDDSLAVLHKGPTGRAVDVIDLAGTMQHKELRVVSRFTLATDEGFSEYCPAFCGNPMWCWRGKVYTTTDRDEHLVCVTTGERILLPLPPGIKWRTLLPVGGPYFALHEECTSNTVEVFSVMDPTKVCFTHIQSTLYTMFWNEIAVTEEGTAFQVVDAPSGLLIFTITTSSKLRIQSLS
ncbi:hypothetical protein Pelo_17192 [Pelomyxa schiedti]|nr:hypothetical protein Pelo_17192 [Pelomyxa schiedti]